MRAESPSKNQNPTPVTGESAVGLGVTPADVNEVRFKRLEEWKAWAAAKLGVLAQSEKREVKEAADRLLTDLMYLDLTRLAHFLVLVHYAGTVDRRFLELLPSEKEVLAWFGEGDE